jgi:ABC-type transporter Mla subunit MlaD
MHIQESITGSARPTIPRSIVMPGLTILWLVVVAIFLQLKIGLGNVFALSPGELGGVIAGIVAPLALAGVILLLRERARSPSGRVMLDRVAGAAGAAVEQAAAVTGELQRQAESLRDSTTDATRAVAMTGQLFHQHSKEVAESAAQLASSVEELKQALLLQAKDMSDVSQKLGEQRASLAEAARAEATSLAEKVTAATQGIANTVKAQGEQFAGLAERTTAQGAAVQAALRDQAAELERASERGAARFAESVGGLAAHVPEPWSVRAR